MEHDQTFKIIFKAEAQVQIQRIADDLLELEKNSGKKNIINEIFRNTHTLKGNASLDGFDKISRIAHTMENIFDILRDNKTSLTPEQFDKIFQSVDTLEILIKSINTDTEEKADISIVLEKLNSIVDAIQPDIPGEKKRQKRQEFVLEKKEKQKFIDEIRNRHKCFHLTLNFQDDDAMKGISSYIIYNNLKSKTSNIITHPDMEFVKQRTAEFDKMEFILSTDQVKADLEKVIKLNSKSYELSTLSQKKIKEWVEPATEEPDKKEIIKDSTEIQLLEIEVKYIEQLIETLSDIMFKMNMIGGLNSALMDTMEEENLPDLYKEVIIEIQGASLLFNAAMDQALNLRLVPIKLLFNKFPRIIRDLSRSLNKKVEFTIKGEKIRVGQKIMETLEAPLLHLVRNAMDHGIESLEIRKKRKKKETGKIVLSAQQKENKINIVLKDDGQGLNKDKIIQKGIKKGLINDSDIKALSDDDIYKLIFTPGFSTKDESTMVSGRGVGMDVVLHDINKVGGTITINSEKNKGTEFIITVPVAT